MNDEMPAPSIPPTQPPAQPPATGTPRGGADRFADRAGREPGELIVALSPRQVIGGFAVLAALILMLRRRSRRKR
jgi:hypothetical protein